MALFLNNNWNKTHYITINLLLIMIKIVKISDYEMTHLHDNVQNSWIRLNDSLKRTVQ